MLTELDFNIWSAASGHGWNQVSSRAWTAGTRKHLTSRTSKLYQVCEALPNCDATGRCRPHLGSDHGVVLGFEGKAVIYNALLSTSTFSAYARHTEMGSSGSRIKNRKARGPAGWARLPSQSSLGCHPQVLQQARFACASQSFCWASSSCSKRRSRASSGHLSSSCSQGELAGTCHDDCCFIRNPPSSNCLLQTSQPLCTPLMSLSQLCSWRWQSHIPHKP